MDCRGSKGQSRGTAEKPGVQVRRSLTPGGKKVGVSSDGQTAGPTGEGAVRAEGRGWGPQVPGLASCVDGVPETGKEQDRET